MNNVCWLGAPPPRKFREALRRRGVQLSLARSVDEARPCVLATPRADRPPARAPSPGPWLWAAQHPGPEARRGAVLLGAYDVIDLARETAAAELAARLDELALPPPFVPPAPTLVTSGLLGRALLRRLALAARTSMPVLLTGETGSGKEVAARLIHAWSSRAAAPFVPINCGAIPNDLMEAELFGYARGAFSGAVAAYEGLISSAEGGTVFLDEIDETPMSLQAKLLRVLEDRVVSRLGDSRYRKIDFRLIAATNRDLRPLIASGAFGADLYERLAIVSIHMPPLRERVDDLPDLCRHFIARFFAEEPAAKERVPVTALRDDALLALRRYPWPGNIRELRNVLFETLVYKRGGDTLLLSDLPRRVLLGAEEGLRGLATERDLVHGLDEGALRRAVVGGRFNLRRAVEALQRAALREALAVVGGNAASAARLLGEVGRGHARDPGSTARAMMRRLGLDSTAR